jgi:hypothetical protein
MDFKEPEPQTGSRRKHFDYLVTKYLPKHQGWKWAEGRKYFL